jgi:hypothetical protein
MGTECPIAEEFLLYLNWAGRYTDGETWLTPSVTPLSWWCLYADSPIAKFCGIVASLPASSAPIERVWSHMHKHVTGRPRLSAHNLFHEVFVALNR